MRPSLSLPSFMWTAKKPPSWKTKVGVVAIVITISTREKIRVRFVDDGKLYEWNPKGKVGPMMLVKIKEVPWWKEANKMLNGLGKDEFLEVMKEVA